MFSSMIKPWRSLDDIPKELLEQRLIVQVSEGAYLVNEERIQDEEDLIYWESIKKTLDKAWRRVRNNETNKRFPKNV
ncbi:MAG: hypothetical protein J7L39_03360 [Candidatus Aenigmarchaeota archaeon]|nr:hypothetical protein [Candidatus Aenigmarchaeota archaeon]